MYICVVIIFISQRHKGLNVGVRAIFAASQVVARRRKFSQNSLSYYISYVQKKNPRSTVESKSNFYLVKSPTSMHPEPVSPGRMLYCLPSASLSVVSRSLTPSL